MAEEPETPKILEELSKSNTAKASNRSSRQQQKARRRFTIVAILFLPLLGGGAFLAYQQQSSQLKLAAITAENQQLTLTLSNLTGVLQQLQEQVQQELSAPQQAAPVDDSAVRELESKLNLEIQTLTRQLAELQSQQLTPVNAQPNFDWKLLEAEYLLGLANRKIQLEADPAAAISLLESADTALLESGNSNVFAVRQSIAQELVQLRNVEPVDQEGIFIRIGNLTAQIEAIDLRNSMRQNFENRGNTETQALQVGVDSSGWIDSSLSFLSSIFVWRKWEDTPEAMLAPGQDTFIKQNLRLHLEQAQLALLMGDNGLYNRSLDDSREWLLRHSLTDSSSTQTMLAELNALESINISPGLPSLNQSLQLISQLTTSER